MNDKILITLEFGQICERLKMLAITDPAKQRAVELQPSTDPVVVADQLQQTLAVVNLMRLRGRLPLTNFADVRPSTKRLAIEANLNTTELGNLRLVLELATDVNGFVTRASEAEVDLASIQTILTQLTVPTKLYQALKHAIEFDGTVLDTASERLARLRHDLASNELDIKARMAAYARTSSKYLSEAIVTIRDGRYVVPVKQEYKAKFGGVVHDQSASGQTLFIEPAAVLELNNRQQNLLAEEKQEIQRILKHLSALAKLEITPLNNLADGLIALDFLQAKARLAKQMHAVEPKLTTDQSLDLRKARHPLIDPAHVVSNDIVLGHDFDTMLITGPNTGGKTLTLKTVGLLQIMAQSGLFIPAAEDSKVGVFSNIFADIGDEQSIEQSLSTFSSHINDIVAIMKQVNATTLVLIDEIGAGTDPEEGASLAMAILDFLRQRQAKILVTTHYPELKLYGYNRERTTNASMAFDLKTLSPTYRLQIGIPGHSNAFAIARRLGMREDVVKKAEGLVDDSSSDINTMIKRLNEQTKQATTAREHLQSSLAVARQLEDQLTKGLDWYRQRVQKQLDFAQTRANEIVAKRRQQAEKLIKQLEAMPAGKVREDQLIATKGQFNQLQHDDLAHNKILQREKRRHHVQVGDQVKVLSYGQVGTVTKQLSEHEFEVQLGILKMQASDRDLEKLTAKKHASAPVRATSGLRRSTVHSKLDLRGQRYDEAMTSLDRYFDSVLLAGLDSVVIVHGGGTGAIRKGVWSYLKRNRHVKDYHYAPANEGGTGATLVSLK